MDRDALGQLPALPDDDEQLPALPDDDDLVPASVVKRENGNVCDMTVWRWQRHPRIQFPPPDFVINNRRYWTRRTLRRHRRRLERESARPSKTAEA